MHECTHARTHAYHTRAHVRVKHTRERDCFETVLQPRSNNSASPEREATQAGWGEWLKNKTRQQFGGAHGYCYPSIHMTNNHKWLGSCGTRPKSGEIPLDGVGVCGCVGVWVCGCVGVWVCGCVRARVSVNNMKGIINSMLA